MKINNLKNNTVLQVIDEENNEVYRATFHEPYREDSFFFKSKDLYLAAENNTGKQYRISFYNEDCICTFVGEVQRVLIKSGALLTLLQQVSEVEETSQRKFQREDITIKLNIYDLSGL